MKETTIDPASGTARAEIALLLDFYGNTLTERQRRTAELYFQEDLSLTEIAELFGITRQGVRDGLKKAEKILYETEEQLKIAERFRRRQKYLSEALTVAEQCRDREAGEMLRVLITAAMKEE